MQLLFIAATLLVAVGIDSRLLADDPTRLQIDRIARPYIDTGQVVGLSIGLLQGTRRTTVHLGKTRVAGDRPGDDTIYEIASISKLFTGLLLADAVVRKDLRLNQPAGELLPENVKMPAWPDRSITLLDLATHRSGLPRLADNMPSLRTDNPYADYTSTRAYAFLNAHPLRRAPGEQYEYSNFAFALLGHLICNHANRSYDQLIQQRIAGPLGMTDTRTEMTDSMRERLATPHNAQSQPIANWDFADLPGAGGIRSSLGDMLRFAMASLNPESSTIEAAIDLAWQEHHSGRQSEPAMGLGWHFSADGSGHWHNGQTGGYHTMLMIDRKASLAIIVLSNTATHQIDTLAIKLMQSLRQHAAAQ